MTLILFYTEDYLCSHPLKKTDSFWEACWDASTFSEKSKKSVNIYLSGDRPQLVAQATQNGSIYVRGLGGERVDINKVRWLRTDE